jgi:hypothetical protein
MRRFTRLGGQPLEVFAAQCGQHAPVVFAVYPLEWLCTGDKIAGASVPSMGRISLDERSQPGPMTATVVNRKA